MCARMCAERERLMCPPLVAAIVIIIIIMWHAERKVIKHVKTYR